GQFRPHVRTRGPGQFRPRARTRGPGQFRPRARTRGPGQFRPHARTRGPGQFRPRARTRGPGQFRPHARTRGPGQFRPRARTRGPGQFRPHARTRGPGQFRPRARTRGPGQFRPHARTRGPGQFRPHARTRGPGQFRPRARTRGPGQFRPRARTRGPGSESAVAQIANALRQLRSQFKSEESQGTSPTGLHWLSYSASARTVPASVSDLASHRFRFRTDTQTQTDKWRRASSPISRSILADPLTRGMVGLGNPGSAPRCYAQTVCSPKKTTRVQSQSQAARIFTTSSNLVPPLHSIQEGPDQCVRLLFIARKLQGNKEILLAPALSVTLNGCLLIGDFPGGVCTGLREFRARGLRNVPSSFQNIQACSFLRNSALAT
uniref:Uncharacterized protein n=1 Tax=Macaca mulatta TaxID=9544 RepID=A0A5F7ZLT6_MACMU